MYDDNIPIEYPVALLTSGDIFAKYMHPKITEYPKIVLSNPTIRNREKYFFRIKLPIFFNKSDSI